MYGLARVKNRRDWKTVSVKIESGCQHPSPVKYSHRIKGVRVVGVEMGVPNCMQNCESVESWRRYWYRSGETKLLNCTSVPHKHMRFYMYIRYRICNNYVLLTDLTTSNRNNRLESEMTTLGPACRLLGFIKMSDFSACLLYSSLLKQWFLTRFMQQSFVSPTP